MEEILPRIEYGSTPKVLVLGNGINRAYGFTSWEELIESVRTKNLTGPERASVKHVPYPLQPVILTGNHCGEQLKKISGPLSERRADEEEERQLRQFASLPVNAILTANYTYELEKALDPKFRCLPGRRCKARRLVYDSGSTYANEQLHTFFAVGDYPTIWHIHGEAAKFKSMIFAHYYYGKLLAKMQQYMASLLARCNTRYARQNGIEVRSWLDYFMLGEVHIAALGMSLSELDLWWLVNCKKRHFPEKKITLYKFDIKPEEKLLADAYGMEVEDGGFRGNFKGYYDWLYEEINQRMQSGEPSEQYHGGSEWLKWE